LHVRNTIYCFLYKINKIKCAITINYKHCEQNLCSGGHKHKPYDNIPVGIVASHLWQKKSANFPGMNDMNMTTIASQFIVLVLRESGM